MAMDEQEIHPSLGDSDKTRRVPRPLVKPGEETATTLALLPWLGVPVLASAALARLDRSIPGEVLPVVAFLPLLALVFAATVWLPPRRRPALIGSLGLAVLVALLGFLGRGAGTGASLTFFAATGATLVATLSFWLVARGMQWAQVLTVAGAAMVFGQALDGFQTYLAVDNPFGWLPEASTERVLVSRLVLEAAPPLYPLLKIALAVAVAYGLGRRPLAPTGAVLLVLTVCYAGLSPAMFSAAHMFAA